MPSLPKRRRARDAIAAAAAAAASNRPDADFAPADADADGGGAPPPSALDVALDALTARQAATRSRGLVTLHAALKAHHTPVHHPLSLASALSALLAKRGGSGDDAAVAGSCIALTFLHAGPSADALAAYEGVVPALTVMAASVKGGPPGARAAACTALAVGAFVVGDAGGPEVVAAADTLATAAASRVLALVGPTAAAAAAAGVGGSGAGAGDTPARPPPPASAVAAAALRGLALLATVMWPSQVASLAVDGRVLRAMSGALASPDVDVRHAAGLAAVALRSASGRAGGAGSGDSDGDDDGGDDDDGEASSEGEAAHAALAPALARVRGLASSSHAALNTLDGGTPSGAATPTGFRCGNGLRLSRAARTEQRRLFRGLEAVGCGASGAAEVRAAALKKLAGGAWTSLLEESWLGEVFGGGGGGRGGPGGAAAARGGERARDKARAKGRAGAAGDRVAWLLGEESVW